MDPQTVYTLSGVSRRYGELAALDNVDLTIHMGEWLSVVGPSGSGKTTLMNILGCMDLPTSGTVLLGQERLDRQGERELAIIRRQRIGLIFQKFHLIKHLTALENIMVAQYYHSIPDEVEARAALDRVGLGERAGHLPRQLSGGEQQRVCVARALINSPSVVLADEPTGNLDVATGRSVFALLRELQRKRSLSAVIVTHNPEIAAQCDRVLQLEQINRPE